MNDEVPNSWPTIILVYCLSLTAAMVVSEGVPALGGIAAELHPRSPALIGWVMSIPALVVALGGLATGWLVDKTGDRRMLLIGGVAVVIGDGGVIASGAIGPLLGWRVVAGLGYAFMAVASVTMLMRITVGRTRVAALALWSTVIPASFIGAFALGVLVASFGWRWVFGTHAAIVAVLLAIGMVALPARGAGEPTVSRTSGLLTVLRSPRVYALGTSFAVAAFLQSGMIAVLAKLLAMRIGATEAQVNSFGIVAMLFNMGGALAVGALLNRRVPAWIIGSVGAALAAVSTLILAMAVRDLATAIVIDCGLMLGCGLLAGMWALLPRVAPSPQTMGAASGLVTQITLIGVLFGAPMAFAALGMGAGGFIAMVVIMLLGTAAAVPVWLRPLSATPNAVGGTAAPQAVH